MSVRTASTEEGSAIREIVERSMNASYSLNPSTIEAAIEEFFGDETIESVLADDDRTMLVAERDGDVVGVADVVYVTETGTGDVLWLHVHPEHRGLGIGHELFEAARDWLNDAGAEVVRGLVLTDNSEGNTFYQELGFEQVGDREVEIDDTPYTERVYHDEARERMDVVVDEGRDVYVDRDEADRGSMGPFYTVYADAERDVRYGYHCGNCETIQTAMDSMGRMECSSCGNTRKPTRWDASYL